MYIHKYHSAKMQAASYVATYVRIYIAINVVADLSMRHILLYGGNKGLTIEYACTYIRTYVYV